MAEANPINAWDMLLLAATETTLGTPPTFASTAAYAALAVESISANLGPSGESGVIRPKQDRNLGRMMQSGFVEGRVAPIPWEVAMSLKSRSAVDAAPDILALYKACGLTVTTNASTSVVLTPSGTPIESSAFAGATLYRFLGSSLATYLQETLRGCVARTLRIEGGGSEVMMRFGGVGLGKYTAGALDSVTFALAGTTSFTHTAEESYRLDVGYYLIESEVIYIGSVTRGGTSTSVTRGALGTTAAAHTAKPLNPYRPTAVSYSGVPISEANATCSIDSVAARVRSWSVDISTGMDLLEPESGSAYSQGARYGRFDVTASVQMVMPAAQASLLGKATERKLVAVSLAQGSGAGAVITIALPYAEVVALSVPDTANDVAIIDVGFRLRDNGTGNNAFSITLT